MSWPRIQTWLPKKKEGLRANKENTLHDMYKVKTLLQTIKRK